MIKKAKVGIVMFTLILSIAGVGVAMELNSRQDDLRVESECRENLLSYDFVKTVIETDRHFGIETNTESIVSELEDLFVRYGDPYAVLMIHHYGEELAVELTSNFENYIEDEYTNTFFEKEQKNVLIIE